jgi:superfamily II DNA or RNA helicase
MQRYSSRRQKLNRSFLEERLTGAVSYDRIAGYFSSSLLEIAAEAVDGVSGTIRMICNSDLDVRDVETAKAAQQAMRQEWCASDPERIAEVEPKRFQRLHDLLRSKRLQVKVLPKQKFGLMHGKAGVIRYADDKATSFLGSVNATASGWASNYELLWEDDSEESVAWVQEEFDALWNHSMAVPLADFVMKDVGRLGKRSVIPSVEQWQSDPSPESAIIELPVFREGFGLWEHQKYFVGRVFEAHQRPQGARFVLADMVGLGKTLQLTLSAMLMALQGDKPILVLAPKTLLKQWQDEMVELLDMPSAIWDSQKKQWVDENEIAHPAGNHKGIKNCPRRVGIVSQGLITHQSEAADYLKKQSYECVIVDEAHKARRRNRAPFRATERPEANNLMKFLLEISTQTKSMLLATATPVQLHPLEGWDLLHILAQNSHAVLGNDWSKWRGDVGTALDIVMGEQSLPAEPRDLWEWVRNPLPPKEEGRVFELARRTLSLSPADTVAEGSRWDELRRADQQRIARKRKDIAQHHNPFIRHVVRRTRKYLETTINPATGEPYLDPIKVELHGEGDSEAIPLPTYLQEAYEEARRFCKLLKQRTRMSGFMETLLLRRVGSSIHAGRKTAQGILENWSELEDLEAEYASDDRRTLSPEEKSSLEKFIELLGRNVERDPKYYQVIEYLLQKGWLSRGCIIFSQYYASAKWLGQQLSEGELQKETIGLYAGRGRSGIFTGGSFHPRPREELKTSVRDGTLRLLLGTQSASEGLNLQRLGTLINLDLPWNPTRLEQRKGRIQRIGQRSDTVHIYNMRYRGSVEDEVHQMLSHRLEQIHSLFGQIPDVLEDAWVSMAFEEKEAAKRIIDQVPEQHPFEMRYEQIEESDDWETCATVLEAGVRRERLTSGW